VSSSVQIQLFTKRICALMDIISENEDPLRITDEEMKRSSLVQKACAFALVESLYDSLPASAIKKAINNVYVQQKLKKNENEAKVPSKAMIR
jgi:hypothetical protein